jgi:hypothetical protein
MDFDECDHPIPYNNKELSKNWFVFDDTSVLPIRVGKLRKQFQSNENAYMLFYIRKTELINPSLPPAYLDRYIQDLNAELEIKRSIYEEELQSLNVEIFKPDLFYIDEFGIFSIKEETGKDLEKQAILLKLKFYNKLSDVIDSILPLIKEENTKKEDILLYEISYRKESNGVVLIQKYSYEKDHDQTLVDLKILHNSRLIIINKSSTSLDLDILDKQVGNNFEPVSLHIIHGSIDKMIRVFSNMNVNELKEFIKEKFNLSHLGDFDINLKSQTKNVNLAKTGWDRKNECWLTLKQLRIVDKNIIFITKSSAESNKKNDQAHDSSEPNEKITTIIKFEDDEENVHIVKIYLNQTFEELVNKIKKKLNLPEDSTIRLRKELDGKIIYKNFYSKKIYTDDMFPEGSVRLVIEFGDPYLIHETLLKIIVELNPTDKIEKDFIGDFNKTTVADLKKLICENDKLKLDEYQFQKTNAFKDPVKAVKNEAQLLSKAGLNDGDCLYLKNISAQLYETYYIKVFKPKENTLEKDYNFVFQPVSDDMFLCEVNLPKETTLHTLKEIILENINSNIESGKIGLKQLRVRVLGKKLDPERILRGDSTVIKKFGIDNPGNLLVEILPEEENLELKENQLQLYLFHRNTENKIYYDKTSVIFEFANNFASSDQLYELIRKKTECQEILLAKYSKYYYTWEEIPEMEENGPVNLRKGPFNIRDGDWIGWAETSKHDQWKDDWQTVEDKRVIIICNNLVIGQC